MTEIKKMLKNLIIINAGNFGREVFSWAEQMPGCGVEWRIKGFLDSRRDILAGHNYDVPILASPEDYIPAGEDFFICALGDPAEKKRYCKLLLNRGGKFTNIIHPTVVLGKNVKLGNGVILCPNVVVSCDAIIGNFVGVNLLTSVGHDVVIDDFCQINPNVSIGGGSVLREAVTVGSNAVILPKATVEEFAVVGAGSVVLRKVKAHQTVFGVPAKPVALPEAAFKKMTGLSKGETSHGKS